MKIWVGVTDKSWYEYLSQLAPEEVNFWRPSGSRSFRVLEAGEPFLFKLHSPENYIVGGGFFVRYSTLPASLAWDAFERKNGVPSYSELLLRVRRYRNDHESLDPIIGCNILAEPFFLPRSKWIPMPLSWASNIVQGKSYDSESGDGQRLWNLIQPSILDSQKLRDSGGDHLDGEIRRFGTEYLTKSRLGQGAFRVLVTDAYQRRCAVTGEKTLPVLEAAHIKPYALEGPHYVANGLLLRSDLHKLFDLGYVTVTPEHKLLVSSRLRAEWENGREYYAYHGRDLQCMPVEATNFPNKAFLQWHNENTFKG
jgi:putative restriction endonuclease